jgi:hypothetical protein
MPFDCISVRGLSLPVSRRCHEEIAHVGSAFARDLFAISS